MLLRVALRERGFAASVAASALLLGLLLSLLPVLSERGQEAVAWGAVEALQPLVEVYVYPLEGVLNISSQAVHAGEAALRLAEAVPGGFPGVVAPALVDYAVLCRAGGGFDVFPRSVEGAALQLRVRSFYGDMEGAGTCALYSAVVYAFSPLSLEALEGLGFRLLEGRWPREAGEAALALPLARGLGVGVGGEASLGGFRVRVVGVYEPPPGMMPAGFGWDRGLVGVVAPPGPEGMAWLLRELGAVNVSEPALNIILEGADLPAPQLPPEAMGEEPYIDYGRLLLRLNGSRGLVPVPAVAGAFTPVHGYIGYVVEGRDVDEIVEAAGRLVARVHAAAAEAGARVEVYSDASRLEVLRSPQTLAPMMMAAASAIVAGIMVGYYSGLDASAAAATRFRRLASLLVLRGASSARIARSLVAAAAVAAGAAAAAASAAGYAAGSGVAAAAGLAALPVTVLAVCQVAKGLADVKPVEAVRPVAASAAAVGPRIRGRAGGLLVVLSLASTVIGLSGVHPEELVNAAERVAGAGGAALAVVAVVVAMLVGPLAAAVLAVWLVETLSGPLERVYSARVYPAVAGLLAGSLRGLVVREARRLWGRLLSTPSAAAYAAAGVSLGAVAASLLAAAAGASASGVEALEYYAAVAGAVEEYRALALFSLVVYLVAVYAAAASTLGEVEAEAVVAMVRGASRRLAAGVAAALLAAGTLYTALLGLLAGSLASLAALAYVRLLANMMDVPPAAAALSFEPLLAVIPLALVLALVYPLLAARRLVSGSLAARLRRLYG